MWKNSPKVLFSHYLHKEGHGSNPDIGYFIQIIYYYCQLNWKDEIKKRNGQKRPIFEKTKQKIEVLGREPWSSGYGRRLMFERSRVWIPAAYIGWTWLFSHWFVVKIVLIVWKDQNKQKEAGIGPFFKR